MKEHTTPGPAARAPALLRGTVRLLCAVACGVTTLTMTALAPVHAQSTYPDRPLRLIVPFPPGGGNDILARTFGQGLTEALGQQIIVDNRGGAGGMIGGQIAATAAPDGYTLFLGSVGSLAHNPALRKDLPYNPTRDFAPASLLATSPFILVVTPALPAGSMKELLALARAKPGSLNYASAGTGSSLHMTAELFKHTTGINIVHVPYKGAAPALTDLFAGRVQMLFSTMPPAVPHVKSGKVRALGVSSAARNKAVPDVPTIIEGGVKGFEVENWQGIVLPAKTPAAMVAKLNREIVKVLATPAMIESLRAQGLDAKSSTPTQFGELIRVEIARWTKLVAASGIKVD